METHTSPPRPTAAPQVPLKLTTSSPPPPPLLQPPVKLTKLTFSPPLPPPKLSPATDLMPSKLTNPNQPVQDLQLPTSRHSSASSVKSCSSSGVSSMSSSCSSNGSHTVPQISPPSFFSFSSPPRAYHEEHVQHSPGITDTFSQAAAGTHLILSSQMVLQGQFNDGYPNAYQGIPFSCNSSPAVFPLSSSTEARWSSKISRPVVTQPHVFRSLALTSADKPSQLSTSSSFSISKLLTKAPSPCRLAKSPTPTVLPTSSSPLFLSLPSPQESTTLSIPQTVTAASTSSPVKPMSVDSTDSMCYRTTPKNREKDRYISALALIELSKR